MATIVDMDLHKKDYETAKNTINADNVQKIEVLGQMEALAETWVQDKFAGDFIKSGKYFQALLWHIREQMGFDSVDSSDIELLDKIFNSYVALCFMFAKLPTIEMFAILCGISRQTIFNWQVGKARQTTHQATAQRWWEICKGSLIDSLNSSEGVSPNRIFTAKSCFNVRENSTIFEEVPQIEVNTLAEIQAKMGIPMLPGE